MVRTRPDINLNILEGTIQVVIEDVYCSYDDDGIAHKSSSCSVLPHS